MVRRGQRQSTDRYQATKYRNVGAALLESADALQTIAVADARYANAIAVVAIHAAIAYNDALTIAYGEFKSTEGDHEKAPDALLQALGHRAPPERVEQFQAIVKKKDSASYRGEYYTVDEASRLLERVRTFCAWADEMYEQRPPR
jgi:hypothetical protein